MTSDYSFDHSLESKMIDAFFLSISGSSSEDDS